MISSIDVFLLLSIFSCLNKLPLLATGSFGGSANSGVQFEGSQTTNLTAHLGSTAILDCKIRNYVENNPVSWIRLRDWHILSTGQNTFTQDERFTVRHTPGGNDWTLAIKFVSTRDQGVYVCQVSTPQGSLSHYYNLGIIVPRAYILGADEYYAMEGGSISLVCIIEDTLEPPQYVFWYHNEKIINYDTKRTRVSFDLGQNSKKTSSRLVIASVQKSDSGNYTCGTTHAEPSTISVYVSRGDKTLHLQDSGSSTVKPKFVVFTSLLILPLVVDVVAFSTYFTLSWDSWPTPHSF